MNTLNLNNITLTTVLLGLRTDENGWQHNAWNVTLSYEGQKLDVTYRMGVGLVDTNPRAPKPPANRKSLSYSDWLARWQTPSKPTLETVLHSLVLDAEAHDMSFNAWCDNFGYDQDSMKAFALYQTCCKQYDLLLNLAGSKAKLESLIEQIQALEL